VDAANAAREHALERRRDADAANAALQCLLAEKEHLLAELAACLLTQETDSVQYAAPSPAEAEEKQEPAAALAPKAVMERKLKRVRTEFQARNALVAEVDAVRSQKADADRELGEAELTVQGGRALWRDFSSKGVADVVAFAHGASADSAADVADLCAALRVLVARFRAEAGARFSLRGVARERWNVVRLAVAHGAADASEEGVLAELVFTYDDAARAVSVSSPSPAADARLLREFGGARAFRWAQELAGLAPGAGAGTHQAWSGVSCAAVVCVALGVALESSSSS